MMRNKLKSMLVLSLAVALVFGACSGGAPSETTSRPAEPKVVRSAPLPPGEYPVQSVAYDDATGYYSIFLIGAPAGEKPLFRSPDVKMARIPDQDIAAGKKSYIRFDEKGEPTLYLSPDFQIAYTHNVVEERLDPSTGSREAVIVRQESASWSPFASAMAGAALGNLLFAPRYYYPPPYAGGALAGYGAMGASREVASRQYAERFGREPQSSRLARTGMMPRPASQESLRSSGRGAGSSRLTRPTAPSKPKAPSRGFGFGRHR